MLPCLGIASLAGLAGVWALKKWQDAKFALPLFLTAQLLQIGILVTYQATFMFEFGNMFSSPLWNLLLVLTWGFAFLFYIFSNLLFPFFLFPWLAAVTLIPVPWLVGSAFEVNTLANVIIFIFWGLIVAASSEAAHRFNSTRKYSLPILLASIPIFINAVASGFSHSNSYGFVAALSVAIIYGVLHLVRPRGWLWALALLSFSVAYLAFFNLPFLEKTQVIAGYQQLGLCLIFLTLELLLKKASLDWTLPPRVFGGLFTLIASVSFLEGTKHAAIGFAVLTVFFIIYTTAQRKAFYGYIPAAFLALTVFFTLDYFKLDAWLPALTGLAVLYFIVGAAIRSKAAWAVMLRYSGLALGTFISFAALFTFKETGGWYVLVIGLLFAAEMHLSRNGWFEIGMPVMFSIGAFLILRDLNFERVTYHVLAYSLVWILSDLLAHLTFTSPRPLKMVVRVIGGLFAVTSYIFLIHRKRRFFCGNWIWNLHASVSDREPGLSPTDPFLRLYLDPATLRRVLFPRLRHHQMGPSRHLHCDGILRSWLFPALEKTCIWLGRDLVIQRAWSWSHRLDSRTLYRRGGCGDPHRVCRHPLGGRSLLAEKCLAGVSRKWSVSAGVLRHSF